MGEKVTTIMVLKVDLQCRRCYKKVKKILCKIPQIQDQVYDEKQNTVTIKVVCCSPEKIKEKIICKGGESIKGIEIKLPPPPKPKPEPEKPKAEPEKPKPAPEKPKAEPEKPKPAPEKPKAEPEKPKPAPEKPKAEPEKPKPPPEKLPESAPKPPPPAPAPVPVPAYPIGVCCGPCYQGRPGGPCFQGQPLPYPSFYGRPVYDSYGCGCGCGGYRPCYVSRCDYFSEESTSGCTVM